MNHRLPTSLISVKWCRILPRLTSLIGWPARMALTRERRQIALASLINRRDEYQITAHHDGSQHIGARH